jgi:hypothetical protein
MGMIKTVLDLKQLKQVVMMQTNSLKLKEGLEKSWQRLN